MKLHLFGSVFVRNDKVEVINSMLDKTIDVWSGTMDDSLSDQEKEEVDLFISFLEDLKNGE